MTTSGLLNSQVSQPQPDPSNTGAPPETNPLLEKIEQGIEDKVPAQLRTGYLEIVVAGNHVLFSPSMLPAFTKVVMQPNFIQQLPLKMGNLMAMISNESGKNAQGQPKMNIMAIGPASMTLACHVLGFYEQVSKMQLNQDQIAQTLHDVAFAVLQKFGIGPEQIVQAQAQSNNQAAQPASPQTAPQTGA